MKSIEVSHYDSKDTTAVPAVVFLLACGAADISTDLKKLAFDYDHHPLGWIVGSSEVVYNNHDKGHSCVSRLVRRYHRHKEALTKRDG